MTIDGSDASAPAYPAAHCLLKDRVVLVTAAAGTGIGFATAKRAAEEGATVVVSDYHERRLGEAVAKLADVTDVQPLAVPCDVRNEQQVQALFEAVYERHGRLDVLVNNAGLGGAAQLVEMTDEQWLNILDVTLTGTMRATRAALRRMIPVGHGVIVNNASITGWRAEAGQAAYAAAKAGVMALTRCAALEAAPSGIRINAVAPSLAMHPFLAKVTSAEHLDQMVTLQAFGRAAEVWEIANVIIFLASDYSSYMTGEVVSVSSQHP
jgi:3-oxoacyl-[acyl-carrier protein] reductase